MQGHIYIQSQGKNMANWRTMRPQRFAVLAAAVVVVAVLAVVVVVVVVSYLLG